MKDEPEYRSASSFILHPSSFQARFGRLFSRLREVVRRCALLGTPPVLHDLLGRAARLTCAGDRWHTYLRRCRRRGVDLSGVVYTSIFNPRDSRKNWQDLLSGFLAALRDRDDATLVVKLVAKDPLLIERVLDGYRRLGLNHRCKIVFLSSYLEDAQMLELARGSTYYLQATRAEGACLPLMNYLAAGRPGISPCHSALRDYFRADMGFAVDWHTEPTNWPHDPRQRLETSWGRIVWPHLVEQIRTSYEIARQDRAAYDALSARARSRMADWASMESVWPRLCAALDLLEPMLTKTTGERGALAP